MQTPEGKIKDKLRKVLASHQGRVYVYWPVPSGYGSSSVDCLGCASGVFFAIECKRAGGKPTARQQGVLDDVDTAGGVAFVVNDDESLLKFAHWLMLVCRTDEERSELEA